jgi:hypothetical protein
MVNPPEVVVSIGRATGRGLKTENRLSALAARLTDTQCAKAISGSAPNKAENVPSNGAELRGDLTF